jgi:protein TonB
MTSHTLSLPIPVNLRGVTPEPFLIPPTKNDGGETFLRAMLEVPSTVRHTRNPLEWAVSLLVHVLVITSLIVAPLYFSEKIDLKGFTATFLVGPPPPPLPPPPAGNAMQRVARTPVARLVQSGRLMAPTAVPRTIAILNEEPLPPDPGGVVGGVPGGVPGGQIGGVLGGIIGGVAGSSLPAIASPSPPPAAKRTLRVGGQVKAPKLIQYQAPVYPTIARVSKVQGVVLIDATVDEHGDVVEVHILSGPGLLLQAALDAVMRWKYEPTYLNGQPFPVQMHVTVNFTLN